MFSITRAASALLIIAPLMAVQAQAQQKFAYIDSRDILSKAPATPGVQAVMQREGAAMQAVAQRMSDSLETLTTKFTKEQATLGAEKREARIKEINDKQGEFQVRYEQLRQQAQDREAELMQPVLDQIKLVLEDLRVELGYTMIFDISQSAAIVAADKNLNISDRVVAKLRTMPLPVIADRAAPAGSKADPKAAGKAPTGGPVSAPAGVRGPGATTPPPGTKRPDSTGKADSTAKKPDSTTRRPPSR
jgi:Skp family chaperone for outer membrane proteins